nr:trihelix transcription factor GTL1-like [Tanacetum cinerariifolium]
MMVSKGCEVSPQQCEDKFNDLNKRYKRLNDILGRGVSCRVVENPSLMDSMPRLSAKMKEDVKKILSSKHLFYPEMCAYHNGQKIPNCESQCVSKATANATHSHRSDEVEDNDESDDDDDDDDMDHEDDDHEND